MPESDKNYEKRREYFHSQPPLSVKEAEEAIHKRMHLIDEEFKKGFDLIVKYPKSVTFFGSARFDEGHKYYEAARALAGKIVKETGYAVVSGGGPGIMEAANRGAKEAGGNSVGFTIKLPKEQTDNEFLTDLEKFHYFFSRKVMLTYSAEAYIYCPGGFGTFDEFYEILTLVQTHKIPKVPIILYCSDFWLPIVDWMKKELVLKFETVSLTDLSNFLVTDDMDKIVEIIKTTPLRRE